MAYIHHSADLHAPSLLARIRAALGGTFLALAEASQANRCRLEAERLSRLSDAELESLGLERDDIVTYAFRRYLYI